MDPIGPDMASQKLASVLIWLIVELSLVELHSLPGEASAELRKERQEIGVPLFRDYENNIIHEADEAQPALIRQPLNLIIDVQAHGRLPDEPANRSANSLRLGPDGFLRIDMLLP